MWKKIINLIKNIYLIGSLLLLIILLAGHISKPKKRLHVEANCGSIEFIDLLKKEYATIVEKHEEDNVKLIENYYDDLPSRSRISIPTAYIRIEILNKSKASTKNSLCTFKENPLFVFVKHENQDRVIENTKKIELGDIAPNETITVCAFYWYISCLEYEDQFDVTYDGGYANKTTFIKAGRFHRGIARYWRIIPLLLAIIILLLGTIINNSMKNAT